MQVRTYDLGWACTAQRAEHPGARVLTLVALGAAFSNTLNMITQHVASISDPGHTKGWRFVRYLASNPLWLFGWVALAGPSSSRRSHCTTGRCRWCSPCWSPSSSSPSVLRRLWIHQQIRLVTWWAAAITCGSLAVFIAVSEPHRGGSGHQLRLDRRRPSPTAGSGHPGPGRVEGLTGAPGGGAGAATATLWALVATFIKAMTDTLTQFGVFGDVHHWPVYALIVVSILAELLNQSARHVGPLSVSKPFIVIVDPIVSIVLKRSNFAEVFTESRSG